MEFIDEEEIRKLSMEEEKKKKLMTENKEEIRKMRLNFVLHTSPLEIVDDAVINNIDNIEFIIDVQNHYFIYQYWCPRSSSSSSSSSCQKHHEYLHPRDDDDEEMILASCRPLSDPPRRKKVVIQDPAGVFAAASDDIISTTLLSDVDILFEYSILDTYEHLVDLKRSITRRISEAKAHVLRVKPRKVRICVDVSQVAKRYFGSPEAATFVAATYASLSHSLSRFDNAQCNTKRWRPASGNMLKWDDWPFKTFIKRRRRTEAAAAALPIKTTIKKGDNVQYFKPASRLSKEALPIKTFEKEDLQLILAFDPMGGGGGGGCSSSSSSALSSNKSSSSSIVVDDDDQFSSPSYSCPLCLNELVIGKDIIKKMPCSHVFHARCLEDWLWTRNTCPLCPFELPTPSCFQKKKKKKG